MDSAPPGQACGENRVGLSVVTPDALRRHGRRQQAKKEIRRGNTSGARRRMVSDQAGKQAISNMVESRTEKEVPDSRLVSPRSPSRDGGQEGKTAAGPRQ